MTYITIPREHENFESICDYCANDIVPENLQKNGGTLLYEKIVYSSDVIILAYNEEEFVGFSSLIIYPEECVYINQIAIKGAYKRQGIGTALVEKSKEIGNASSLDVACHVRDFNVASKAMFAACGFIRDESECEPGNSFYRFKTLVNAQSL